MQNTDSQKYPMRINRYLALKGYSTRKGGDELVSAKKVFINGKLAALGDKVNENDSVTVKGATAQTNYKYFVYNKPLGVITHSPQLGEQEIKTTVPIKNIFPIGRLDKNSEGLIILTNDGRITDRLLNPEYIHEKEYVVKVVNKIAPNFKRKMESGVNIEGYLTRKCRVDILNDHVFKIMLTEGKKHQIRRMCAALGNDVVSLKRIRIMNIALGKMSAGAYRKIEDKELAIFLSGLGLQVS